MSETENMTSDAKENVQQLTVKGGADAFQRILFDENSNSEQNESNESNLNEDAFEENSENELLENNNSKELNENSLEEADNDESDFEPESEPESEPEKELVFSVKASGEEKQVPISELIKNYQLGADYTKKTQNLSEERKELEKIHSELKQNRDFYLQQINNQLQQTQIPDNQVDLEQLKQDDPIKYAVTVAEQTTAKEKQQKLLVEKQEIMRQKSLEQQKNLEIYRDCLLYTSDAADE